jgi:hypothetical protein
LKIPEKWEFCFVTTWLLKKYKETLGFWLPGSNSLDKFSEIVLVDQQWNSVVGFGKSGGVAERFCIVPLEFESANLSVRFF